MLPSLPLLEEGKSYCIVVHNVSYGMQIIEKSIDGGIDNTFIVKPENNIGIDEIRQVIDFLDFRSNDKAKIVVVYEADKMTQEAANAFLKTLEEPPQYAKIILVTSRWSSMLPTIKSRVQRINIPFPTECQELDDFERHIVFWNYDFFEQIKAKKYSILNEEELFDEDVSDIDKIFTIKSLIEKYQNANLDEYVKFVAKISKINNITFLKLFSKVVSWFIFKSKLSDEEKLKYIKICDEIQSSKIANFNYQLTYYVLFMALFDSQENNGGGKI